MPINLIPASVSLRNAFVTALTSGPESSELANMTIQSHTDSILQVLTDLRQVSVVGEKFRQVT